MNAQDISAQAIGWRVSFRRSAVESHIIDTGTILGVFGNDCFIVLLDTPHPDGTRAEVLYYDILTVIEDKPTKEYDPRLQGYNIGERCGFRIDGKHDMGEIKRFELAGEDLNVFVVILPDSIFKIHGDSPNHYLSVPINNVCPA